MPEPSITCPHCLRTSYNINDVANKYCGHCHVFWGEHDMSDFQDAINRLQRAQVDVNLAAWELSRTAWHVAAGLAMEGSKADGIALLNRLTIFLEIFAKHLQMKTENVAHYKEDTA